MPATVTLELCIFNFVRFCFMNFVALLDASIYSGIMWDVLYGLCMPS